MSENNKINEISGKIQEIKKSIEGKDFGGNNDVSTTLNAIISCISDMSDEMLIIKDEAIEANQSYDDLTERVNELEEYIDESEYFEDEDGVVAKIECPYCKAEVVLGEEFLTTEEPKIICGSCKNEIEIISSSCGCGCGCEDEEDGCECGENEECEGDCGCGGKH